ncbi:MAG: efflux RND transporter periplasmic adaptor subunit [Candidatus Aminicenantes bacterium]|nr:efflux RND transporter periplasmic adaptor subunit [Candidatus Aminicenantes bacterium]
MKVKVLLTASVLILIFMNIIGTMGCGGSGKDAAVITMQKESFEIVIPAFGELEAVKSTPILPSPQVRGQQTIAWMKPENSQVKAGETVIRMAASYYVDSLQTEKFNVARLDLEIQDKEKNLDKEKKDIQAQLALTEIEKQLAEVFAARDESIFSRNEIIESSINVEFLGIKTQHLQEKTKQLEKKTLAELQLLKSKKKTLQVKVEQLQSALDSLELKAPHDGILIYEKNWRGEKPRLGMSVWPGMKLAKLPDLNSMEAKVFVLESEAAGLKGDLPATLTLDSSPGLSFNGKVIGMDTIAKSLEENSPLKYFEVKISLEKTDRSIMKPGSLVKTAIFVRKLENVLAVPNQALFFNDGHTYVNVMKSSKLEKRGVKTGDRSLTRTVITEGLTVGEKVVL